MLPRGLQQICSQRIEPCHPIHVNLYQIFLASFLLTDRSSVEERLTVVVIVVFRWSLVQIRPVRFFCFILSREKYTVNF